MTAKNTINIKAGFNSSSVASRSGQKKKPLNSKTFIQNGINDSEITKIDKIRASSLIGHLSTFSNHNNITIDFDSTKSRGEGATGAATYSSLSRVNNDAIQLLTHEEED